MSLLWSSALWILVLRDLPKAVSISDSKPLIFDPTEESFSWKAFPLLSFLYSIYWLTCFRWWHLKYNSCTLSDINIWSVFDICTIFNLRSQDLAKFILITVCAVLFIILCRYTTNVKDLWTKYLNSLKIFAYDIFPSKKFRSLFYRI